MTPLSSKLHLTFLPCINNKQTAVKVNSRANSQLIADARLNLEPHYLFQKKMCL